MALIPELYTLNALSTELGISNRTLGLRLSGVKPDATSGGRPRWTLMSALRACGATFDIKDHPLRAPASSKGARGGTTAAYLAAQTALLEERRRLTEIKRREAEGALRSLDELRFALEAVVGLIRTRLLSLPSKLASRCTDRTVAAAVEKSSREECYDLLENLSKTEIICDPPADGVDTEPIEDDELEDAD